MMENFSLKSADYFAEMDIDESELPQRLSALMDEIDTLSDEYERVGDEDQAKKIQAEIERLDDELLKGLKAHEASKNAATNDDKDAWPEVNTANSTTDNTDENRDGEEESSPYFWMS